MQQPVFKMTLTIQNENTDGIQVYPEVYIRVTEKWWRINIHEPIIWAAIDFYNKLQLDRLPQNPNVTQVDPEIRIDHIDVSEVRLKVALETAPAQRPHGVLGVWSPLLSAIGSAFKIQIHLRKVVHTDRFMRKSAVVPAITNRIWRDLIHNPLHLILSVDVLGMTRSTLASLSKGFAELSTDGQFLRLRSKQVWSRRITGVGDGIIQGTEALAQGVAFGVSGVVRKPVESARQNGVVGLAHGLGRAFVGFIVQPMSGALDFLSLTVDGIGASCARCFEVLNNRTSLQRVRNPRAIRSDSVLREFNEREALGQMILWLAEASHYLGCTKIFKEPSKFAWSDYYEDHFMLPPQRILLVTNKRVMLLQLKASETIDKNPSKIMWDVPWEELLALELAKAGRLQPSHFILHLKNFKRSDPFARVIKCKPEEESGDGEQQAIKICSTVRKMWKAYQSDMKKFPLKVPSSQGRVHFSWSDVDRRDLQSQTKAIVMSREASSSSSVSHERRSVEHNLNFFKIWSSEQESKGRCTLCRKKAADDDNICSIWRQACPSG
ncbi:Vacuolar protein sorting-associated protein 13C [Bienertia sinuspersici]